MNPCRSSTLLLVAICLPLATGGCGMPMGVTAASTAADGASYATTNKTTFDHFASMVTKKDCSMMRVVENDKMCREREDGHDPYSVSYSDPFRSAGEGGVEYSPPLESAGNAPATSWSAAAYQAPTPTAAAPVATPAEPPVASARAPVPAAAPKAHAHKKKTASAHGPKKPAQGQVASRP
jgi:hypothetical protein